MNFSAHTFDVRIMKNEIPHRTRKSLVIAIKVAEISEETATRVGSAGAAETRRGLPGPFQPSEGMNPASLWPGH
jgi:hypothetical protein